MGNKEAKFLCCGYSPLLFSFLERGESVGICIGYGVFSLPPLNLVSRERGGHWGRWGQPGVHICIFFFSFLHILKSLLSPLSRDIYTTASPNVHHHHTIPKNPRFSIKFPFFPPSCHFHIPLHLVEPQTFQFHIGETKSLSPVSIFFEPRAERDFVNWGNIHICIRFPTAVSPFLNLAFQGERAGRGSNICYLFISLLFFIS